MSESLAIFDSNPLLGIVCVLIIFFGMSIVASLAFVVADALVRSVKAFLSVHFQRKRKEP